MRPPKHTIKVLKLQRWMTQHGKLSFPVLETTYPRFNRDGYYLHDDVCWFEHNNRAFFCNKDDFLADLRDLSIKQLNTIEMAALKVLLDRNVADNVMQKLYFDNKLIQNRRNNKRKRMFVYKASIKS